MKTLITLFAAMSLFSAFSFAEENQMPNPIPTEEGRFIDYHCNFESHSKNDQSRKHRLECSVEGMICREEQNGPATLTDRCERRGEAIRIKCSNGFALLDDDVSDKTDDGALWINTNGKHGKLATLHVEDFHKLSRSVDRKFKLDADILFSDKHKDSHQEGRHAKYDAHRLSGECSFGRRIIEKP